MGNIEEPTCCCPVGFGYSLACIMPLGLLSYIIQEGMNLVGLGLCAPCVNLVPCISCTSREALGKKYGLPTADCCCACCAHYCCQTCALYQESVYVKHVLKKEPTCCCYPTCMNCCGGPQPGLYPGAPPSQMGAPHAVDFAASTPVVDMTTEVVTSQPEQL